MDEHQSVFPQGVQRISAIDVDPGSHHYIVLSQLHKWLADIAAPFAVGRLLDYGCGGQPYRQLFQPGLTAYVGADVAPAAGITLDVEIRPDEPLPLPSESFDTVLSTQTIEHVFNFQAYLADCHRLLRPGGALVLTAPMQWRHHEVPFDYWRFTRYGLERSLQALGFEIERIDACGGAYSLLGQIYLSHVTEDRPPRRLLARAINRLSLWLDRRFVDNDDTLLWMCVARKIASSNEK
jgi:SAM-dependent methyltransferase